MLPLDGSLPLRDDDAALLIFVRGSLDLDMHSGFAGRLVRYRISIADRDRRKSCEAGTSQQNQWIVHATLRIPLLTAAIGALPKDQCDGGDNRRDQRQSRNVIRRILRFQHYHHAVSDRLIDKVSNWRMDKVKSPAALVPRTRYLRLSTRGEGNVREVL